MIYDIFLWNGEFQVLDWRLKAMEGFEVTHIALECDTTFQGRRKSLSHIGRGVGHVLVQKAPPNCTCGCSAAVRWSDSATWVEEAHLRNCAVRVTRWLPPDATVLLGDVDEIPDLKLLDRHPLPFRFLMEGRCFTPTWHGGYDIPCTVATTAGDARSPAELRHAEMDAHRGGWHMSYQGGATEVVRKLRSFSHEELNRADVLEAVPSAIRTGWVPWSRIQLTPCEPPPWLS